MKIVKVGSGPYFGLVLQIPAEGQQMFTLLVESQQFSRTSICGSSKRKTELWVPRTKKNTPQPTKEKQQEGCQRLKMKTQKHAP